MDQLWRLSIGVMVVVAALASLQEVDAGLGSWRVVVQDSGISAMHAAVTPNVGSVVLLHYTNQGPSHIKFPGGRCRVTTYDKILKNDCFGHSVILNPVSGVVRPLMVMTDTQCSSGQFGADGVLYQTGGDTEGTKKTRTLSPNCYNVEPTTQICDWVQGNTDLKVGRWYSTNQLLPDGRQIIVGGRNTQTLEFAPPKASSQAITLGLLSKASLYPFVFLLPSGNLFIFAKTSSIIYNYQTNTVVRTFPNIAGNARTYPSGGSAVMLPLTWQDDYQSAKVLVCGGATSTSNTGATCSSSCGLISVTTAGSTWAMENMPMPRCMGDMLLLPDTNALIINGAQKGFQGWMKASVATKSPVLYEPAKAAGTRFTTLASTGVARVYHSTANLITDGSVMVAGSNTHQYYSFTKSSDPTNFPTELSVETFMPPYAGGGKPTIMTGNTAAKYGATLQLKFWDVPTTGQITWLFTMTAPAWSTHSYSHGQRLVTLKAGNFVTNSGIVKGNTVNINTADLVMPKYNTVLPAAYYMLWVVKNGNPSTSCIWVKISN
ncbi:hypothetical protein KC19_9G022400 [Ceratodon purpureus]|uniref:Galactose oxidase n=1 Tax=Ceratodon purpureus TaxID=3225 RepID=A0A8T0GPF5_CERPU|nr:hypothetical protein KC19_9G022400 [Ceratodon purpureus]